MLYVIMSYGITVGLVFVSTQMTASPATHVLVGMAVFLSTVFVIFAFMTSMRVVLDSCFLYFGGAWLTSYKILVHQAWGPRPQQIW